MYMYMYIVRTSFDLNPNQEWTQAQKTQTINLQRVGEKASLNLGKRYWQIVLKGKKLYMYQYKKHHRSCPNGMIDSVEFFLLIVVFLQSFTLFLFFFCPLLFESLFVLYTMVFAPLSPSTCESGVGSFPVPFRPSLNLLLLAVRLLVYCSGITSTLMRPESQLGSI